MLCSAGNILPEEEVPETGTVCHISRRAAPDGAILYYKGANQLLKAKVLDCTSDAIQKAASLLDDLGNLRKDVADLDHLRIYLREAPIPYGAEWLDTPGFGRQ